MRYKRVFLLLALLVTLTTTIKILCNNNTKYSANDKKFKKVIVVQGDTLWKIAAELELKQDIRKTVYEIRKINDITPLIYEGQEILVPVQE